MRARRAWATVAAAALLVPSAAGCSDDRSSPPTPSPAPSGGSSTAASSPSATAGPTTLRIAMFGVPEAVAAYRVIAARFERANPGTTVRISVFSDAAAAAEAMVAQLRATDAPAGPVFDVALIDQTYLPDLVATDRLEPLDAPLESRGLQFGDDYQRLGLTAFSAEAGLQCMPAEVSPRVVYFNRAYVRPLELESRGIEVDEEDNQLAFDQFAEAVELVRREADGTRGLAITYLPPDPGLLTALVESAGGSIVDDTEQPTTLQLDSAEAREVLTAYLGLARQRDSVLTERQAAEVDPVDRFAAGDLAMLFGTRADLPRIRAAARLRFDVMPVPDFGTRRTVSDINGLCVDEESPSLDLAIDFVASAVSESSGTVAARSGAVVPSSLDAVFSPAFQQRGQRPRSFQVYVDSLKRTTLLPYSRNWRQVSLRVEEMMSTLMARGGDLEKQLDRRLPALDEESRELFADVPE